MSMTVYFEGTLKNEELLPVAIYVVQSYGIYRELEFTLYNEEEVTLKRTKDNKEYTYTGPISGIEIFLPENSEPLRFEFDSQLFFQGSCKTQYAPIDTHIMVIELFERLKECCAELHLKVQ